MNLSQVKLNILAWKPVRSIFMSPAFPVTLPGTCFDRSHCPGHKRHWDWPGDGRRRTPDPAENESHDANCMGTMVAGDDRHCAWLRACLVHCMPNGIGQSGRRCCRQKGWVASGKADQIPSSGLAHFCRLSYASVACGRLLDSPSTALHISVFACSLWRCSTHRASVP